MSKKDERDHDLNKYTVYKHKSSIFCSNEFIFILLFIIVFVFCASKTVLNLFVLSVQNIFTNVSTCSTASEIQVKARQEIAL